MLELIIFDFDGVIADSFPDQFNWFKHIATMLRKDFPYNSPAEFSKVYREPIYPDMYTFLGFDWEKEKGIIWKEYHEYKAKSEIGIFKGIDEVIMQLSEGHKLAIASSNMQVAITRQLQKHGLDKRFSTIIGKEDLPIEDDRPLIKPHPACILKALDATGYSSQESIYIGDQPADILAAKVVAIFRQYPVPIIAVNYGYTAQKERLLALNPDYFAEEPAQILSIIRWHSDRFRSNA